MPWSEKYAPSSLSEIVGQPTEKIKIHARNNPRGKALFIWGPAGCGKSSSVVAFAKEQGYQLVQMDAGESPNAERIKNVIGNASITGSLFGRKVILVDDVDTFDSRERGITELIEVIKKTRVPIFLTAINPWEPKLRTLRGRCELVEFKGLNSSIIKGVLKKICIKEGIKVDDSVLYSIALHSRGDVRAAINNLEMLGYDKEITKFDLEAMGYREREVSIFDALKVLFKGNFEESLHSLDEVNLDFEAKLMWVTENICNEYSGKKEISSAFNWLSRADVFNGRVRSQYWRFLLYATAFMTVGVNSVGIGRGRKYSRPSKLLKLWRSKFERELRKQAALKLQPAYNTSIRKIIESLPFLKLLLKKEKLDYDLTNDEIKVLTQ